MPTHSDPQMPARILRQIQQPQDVPDFFGNLSIPTAFPNIFANITFPSRVFDFLLGGDKATERITITTPPITTTTTLTTAAPLTTTLTSTAMADDFFSNFVNSSLNFIGDVLETGVETQFNSTLKKCDNNASCWLDSSGIQLPHETTQFFQGLIDTGLNVDRLPDMIEGFQRYNRMVSLLTELTYVFATVSFSISVWGLVMLLLYRPLYKNSNSLLSHLAVVATLMPAVVLTLVHFLNDGRQRMDKNLIPFVEQKKHGEGYWPWCSYSHMALSVLHYTQLSLLLLIAGQRALAFWSPSMHYKLVDAGVVTRRLIPFTCWVLGAVLGVINLFGHYDGASTPEDDVIARSQVCSYEQSHTKTVLLLNVGIDSVFFAVLVLTFVIVLVGSREKRKMSEKAEIPVESLSGPDWRSQNKNSKFWAAVALIYIIFLIPGWATKIYGVVSKDAAAGGSDHFDMVFQRMRMERMTEMLRRMSMIFVLVPFVIVFPLSIAKYRDARTAVRACCCCKKYRPKSKKLVGRRPASRAGGTQMDSRVVTMDVRRSAVQISSDTWPEGVILEDGKREPATAEENGNIPEGKDIHSKE